MSFLKTLKTGEIPSQSTKSKSGSETPYDRFMTEKKLKTADAEQQVTIIHPKTFEDVEGLIDQLRSKNGVLFHLGAVDVQTAQRMLDFMSGAAYALQGKVERIDRMLYLITPKGVRIVNRIDESRA